MADSRTLESVAKPPSNPSTVAQSDAEIQHGFEIKNRAAKLSFELITTTLELLATSSPEIDPLTLVSGSRSVRLPLLAAYKEAGFSDDYAEEAVDGAFLCFRLEQERIARKRRLIMFEKRVRQTADTIKHMIQEARDDGGWLKWEKIKLLTKLDASDTLSISDIHPGRKDDERIVDDLEQLAKDARTWILDGHGQSSLESPSTSCSSGDRSRSDSFDMLTGKHKAMNNVGARGRTTVDDKARGRVLVGCKDIIP